MTEKRNDYDVIVVGAGVVGASVAGRLARAGRRTVSVERDEPGRHATRAAAGMLSPLGEADTEGPFLGIALRSLDRYPAFVREVEDAGGVELEHRSEGKLQVAFTDEAAARLERRMHFARERGSRAVLVEDDELRDLEPDLPEDARRGLLIPEDQRLDNRLLGQVLPRWAEALGASFLTGTGVEELLQDEGRTVGVRLADGRRLEAPWVVVAAGCWSGGLAGLPRPLPVQPIRGQIVRLGPGPLRVGRTLESSEGYLVPRDDGSVLAGSTEERAGFEAVTSARGVARILEGALRLLPGLGEHPVAEAWAGLRPGTPDRLPILGPDPDRPGLLYATGHFRNGVLLAPETAEIVARLVAGEDPELDLSPFRPDRFS